MFFETLDDIAASLYSKGFVFDDEKGEFRKEGYSILILQLKAGGFRMRLMKL